MLSQVEPNTKLFPAVFVLPTSQNMLQLELGKLKVCTILCYWHLKVISFLLEILLLVDFSLVSSSHRISCLFRRPCFVVSARTQCPSVLLGWMLRC